MKLDIRQFPAYYINLDRETNKAADTEALLNTVGFSATRVSGIIHEDPKIGCARSHHKVLSDSNIKTGFLVCEDDIKYTLCGMWEYDVPDDADALYLGCSQWARHLNFAGPYLHYRKVNEHVVRVYNMLGGHAIIILTDSYREHLSRLAQYSGYQHGYHMDVAYAETQRYYNVYALNQPFFKQTGYNEKVTSCKISDVGREIDSSRELFDSDKFSLKLAGAPDLNGVGGFYDPRYY